MLPVSKCQARRPSCAASADIGIHKRKARHEDEDIKAAKGESQADVKASASIPKFSFPSQEERLQGREGHIPALCPPESSEISNHDTHHETLEESPSLLPCNQNLTEHFSAGGPAERMLSWNQLANQQRPPPIQQADLTTKLPASALPYPTLQTITTAVSLHPYLVFNFKLSMHERSRRYLALFKSHTCLVLLAFHPWNMSRKLSVLKQNVNWIRSPLLLMRDSWPGCVLINWKTRQCPPSSSSFARPNRPGQGFCIAGSRDHSLGGIFCAFSRRWEKCEALAHYLSSFSCCSVQILRAEEISYRYSLP